jgi:hypothetical protein
VEVVEDGLWDVDPKWLELAARFVPFGRQLVGGGHHAVGLLSYAAAGLPIVPAPANE